MKVKIYLVLILLLSFFDLSLSLSVSFNRENFHCVYDTFYQNTVIIYSYEFDEDTFNKDYYEPNKNPELFQVLISQDDTAFKTDKKVIVPKMFSTSKPEGKFAYTIEETGPYQICMNINQPKIINRRTGTKMMIHLETSIDEYEEDPSAIKMKDFSQVDKKVMHLMKKVEMVQSIQKYQTDLEQEFSVSQIQSNNLISILAGVQILIICIIGGLHVYSLKKILKNKV